MNKEKVEFKQEEEMTDAFGNVIKVKAAKKLKMSNKEKKVRGRLETSRGAMAASLRCERCVRDVPTRSVSLARPPTHSFYS